MCRDCSRVCTPPPHTHTCPRAIDSFVTDVAAGLIRGPMSGLIAPSIHQLALSMAPRPAGAAEPDWRWSVVAELVAQTPESLVNHA